MGSAAETLSRMASHTNAGDRQRLRDLPQVPGHLQPLPNDYGPLRACLAQHGIPFPDATDAQTPGDLDEIAGSLGFPLVMKATHLLHKSDQGGVVTGIRDTETLQATWKQMRQKFGHENLCVETEHPIQQGVELLAGIKIDPRFGPVISVGLGGIYVEVFKQIAVTLAPASEDQVCELITSLPGAALLTGVRGRPALDIMAAARIIIALTDIACRHRHEIESLEINPLLVLEDRAIALDARVVLNRDNPANRRVA